MKDGPATLYLENGDKLEYSYKCDQLQGSATYTWKDGSKETSSYVDGHKTGPSTKLSANGDKEERSYVQGVLQGPAILYGHDGDKLVFEYKVSQQLTLSNYLPLASDILAFLFWSIERYPIRKGDLYLGGWFSRVQRL